LFFKAALVLLASWLLGLLGVYDLGRLVHVLLLVGLLFLLLAATKGRDAVANRGTKPNSDGS
jgi:hypothetical protein